ncbi:hypothetical protein PI125_g23909 [Phytophthora idaei]|nr:hypothetical protein PI125_g23909 [Phytophthora idaei]
MWRLRYLRSSRSSTTAQRPSAPQSCPSARVQNHLLADTPACTSKTHKENSRTCSEEESPELSD